MLDFSPHNGRADIVRRSLISIVVCVDSCACVPMG